MEHQVDDRQATATTMAVTDHAHRQSRAADAVALGAAACGVLIHDGAGEWRTAVALAALSAPLGILSARLLKQYVPANGRGHRGDFVLTLVFRAAIFGPMVVACWLGLLPATVVQVGRFAGVIVPIVVLARYALVGRALRTVENFTEIVIVGIGPLGRITENEVRRAATA